MSQDWKLNDPVTIEQKTTDATTTSSPAPTPTLQGVIAFLGPVSFADGDEWVGIRLTGTSLGKGKNNGTVQGITYFDNCDVNCGMFVKRSSLKKRILTRLEELRLKRQLQTKNASPSVRRLNLSKNTTAAAGTGSGGGGGMSTPGRSVSGGSISGSSHGGMSGLSGGVNDDDSSVTSMSSMRSSATTATTATNRSGRSRLDEIRSKRLALQRNNSKTAKTGINAIRSPRAAITSQTNRMTSTAAVAAAAIAASTPLKKKQPPSTPGRAAGGGAGAGSGGNNLTPQTPTKVEIENSHLKTKIEILTDKLQSNVRQNEELQKHLTTSTKEIHELKLSLNECKASMEQMKQDSETKLASAMAATEVAVAAATAASNPTTDEGDTTTTTANEMKEKEEKIQTLEETIHTLQNTNKELKEQSNNEKNQIQIKYQLQSTTIQESFEYEIHQKENEITNLQNQIVVFEGKVSTLEKHVSEKEEQAALRTDHDSTHYKERAKLQADILSWERKVQEVVTEKLEMEMSMEELTLDKESLQERCEEMEDLVDELKIDTESAQIEIDELRLELENANERAEKAEASIALGRAGGGDGNGDGDGNGNEAAAASSSSSGEGIRSGTRVDAEDVARALSIQNARLREAIIRLREQTAFEKMELTKQLRVAEKDSLALDGLKEEVTKLLTKEKTFKREVNELKEMVDQGSAFEQMVEEMSDRVLAVEDNNIALQVDIRELEEAAELYAEMEEAQADEIKALMKELQNRDTVVVNLEEAIKMQRRRELDFQRTVGNYRKSIDTLQQEKNSLLVLHEGGEGEKKNALIASQKALAQAAQSVADATAARKREADATFNLIDAKVKSHLAERLENFLPQNIASSEISAVKGELLLSKIAMKASLSLNSMSDIFKKTIITAKSALENMGRAQHVEVEKIAITSNLSHEVGAIIHQTKFTQLVIDTSSECLRLLSVSQWPDILSSDASVDFSIAISHSVPQLDIAISEQLLKLKQEGVLSPHQSNLNILTQALQSTRLSLDGIVDADNEPLVPAGWNPPSLEVFKNISSAKFACLGAVSALASIVAVEEGGLDERCSFISSVFTYINNICNEISSAADILACLDITNIEAFESLSMVASDLKSSSWDIFTMIEMLFTGQEILLSSLGEVKTKATATSSSVSKLLVLLRMHKKDNIEESKSESLNPEINDPWEAIKTLARQVKNTTGDADEINYLIRGRNLEEQLSVAVENDAKLSIANTKIRSLEKNLTTRSKEISMQNGRLQELESMLSQTAITHAAVPRTNVTVSQSSEESQELKEEVRILNEAMEVLQTQVDEYEREIRSLKDPQKGKNRRTTPKPNRKSATLDTDFSLSNLGVGNVQKAPLHNMKSGLIEAALFRPALRSARSDASIWKSKTMIDTLQKLPALSAIPKVDNNSKLSDTRQKLLIASAELRRRKANISIVNLHGGLTSCSRLGLKEERKKTALAMGRLEEVTSSVRFMLCS